MAEQGRGAGENGGRRRRWPYRGGRGLAARWILVFLGVLAAVSLLLRIEQHRRRHEIRAAREDLAALVRARPVEGAKARRAAFHKTRFFLAYPADVSFAVADFVRRLALVFRPREMLDLRIDTGLHGFDFRLTVAIVPAPPVAMPWRFAALLDELRGFPEVTRVTFSEKAPAGSIQPGQPQIFILSGQAELP